MGHGFGWAVVSFVILGLLYIPQLATISATFPAMFPTPVRYAGTVGLPVPTTVVASLSRYIPG